VRFKVDENLPVEVAEILRTAGHDAATVNDEAVGGASDPDLASLVRRESRALITLDTGFADIRSYPPKEYKGLVVLRLARRTRTTFSRPATASSSGWRQRNSWASSGSLRRVGSESGWESRRVTRLRAGARPQRGADPRGDCSLPRFVPGHPATPLHIDALSLGRASAGGSRREFCAASTGVAVAGLLAGRGASASASPLGLPIGSQAWPHRVALKRPPRCVEAARGPRHSRRAGPGPRSG